MTMNIYVKDYILLSLLMNFQWCNNKRMNWIEFLLWYLYLQAYTQPHPQKHIHTNISLYVYILPEVAAVRSSFVRSLVRSLIDDWWSWFANYNTTYIYTIYSPHILQNFDISMSWVMICYVVQAAYERFIGVLLSTHFRFDTCVQYIHTHTHTHYIYK